MIFLFFFISNHFLFFFFFLLSSYIVVFLKLAGPELVQMYIGDGAKMIRDAFDLAREKSKDRGGAIIFIDEIDAIGGKRGGKYSSEENEHCVMEAL